MKRMYIKEFLLCSFKEKRARRIQFKNKKTLIIGKNDTGKSCLIKSLYKTFGAEVKLEDTWINADVCLLVKFEIDNKQYQILREGNVFSLFNETGVHLKTFNKVTTGLGPYLADLLNFNLILTTSSYESHIATPAFAFLPFYIDQDKGWNKSFDSFERLQQFKGYRKPAIEYHTGIKPYEYYKLNSEIDAKRELKEAISKERDLVRGVLNKQRTKLKSVDFDIDINNFKNEIDSILNEVNKLKIDTDKYKRKIIQLNEQKLDTENKLNLLFHAIHEKEKDFKYATDILPEHVECPVCRTEFENDFHDRLNIANDMNRLDLLEKDFKKELLEITSEISHETNTLIKKREELATLDNILQDTKQEIKFKDLLKMEGKKEVISDLQKEISEMEEKIYNMENDIQGLTKERKKFNNKEHKDKIIVYVTPFSRLPPN